MSDPHEPYTIDLLAPDEAYCAWCEEVMKQQEMVKLQVGGVWTERCGECVEAGEGS